MVTASLDQLYLQRTILPDKDLLIEGATICAQSN